MFNDFEKIEMERAKVCEMMGRFGGGFASSLGIALGRADFINIMKIKNTWPDLWEQYLKMWHDCNKKGS